LLYTLLNQRSVALALGLPDRAARLARVDGSSHDRAHEGPLVRTQRRTVQALNQPVLLTGAHPGDLEHITVHLQAHAGLARACHPRRTAFIIDVTPRRLTGSGQTYLKLRVLVINEVGYLVRRPGRTRMNMHGLPYMNALPSLAHRHILRPAAL